MVSTRLTALAFWAQLASLPTVLPNNLNSSPWTPMTLHRTILTSQSVRCSRSTSLQSPSKSLRIRSLSIAKIYQSHSTLPTIMTPIPLKSTAKLRPGLRRRMARYFDLFIKFRKELLNQPKKLSFLFTPPVNVLSMEPLSSSSSASVIVNYSFWSACDSCCSYCR